MGIGNLEGTGEAETAGLFGRSGDELARRFEHVAGRPWDG